MRFGMVGPHWVGYDGVWGGETLLWCRMMGYHQHLGWWYSTGMDVNGVWDDRTPLWWRMIVFGVVGPHWVEGNGVCDGVIPLGWRMMGIGMVEFLWGGTVEFGEL